MQKFSRTCSLSVDGAKLLLLADYSIEVIKQRKVFLPVCLTLHNNQIVFSLAYPAVLRIQTHKGEHLTFTTPDKAENYINALGTEMEHINSAEGSSSTT